MIMLIVSRAIAGIGGGAIFPMVKLGDSSHILFIKGIILYRCSSFFLILYHLKKEEIIKGK